MQRDLHLGLGHQVFSGLCKNILLFNTIRVHQLLVGVTSYSVHHLQFYCKFLFVWFGFFARKGLGKKTKRCSVNMLLGKFCSINIKKGRYREWCIISSNNKDFSNSILKQAVVTAVTGESRGRKVFAFLNTGMRC